METADRNYTIQDYQGDMRHAQRIPHDRTQWPLEESKNFELRTLMAFGKIETGRWTCG